jgi:hypothetical protein
MSITKINNFYKSGGGGGISERCMSVCAEPECAPARKIHTQQHVCKFSGFGSWVCSSARVSFPLLAISALLNTGNIFKSGARARFMFYNIAAYRKRARLALRESARRAYI